MDASSANPSAPPVMAADNDTNNPLIPRDETAAILEQTFGDSDTISVDPETNTDAAIGAAMCEKILESSVEKTVDNQDASTAAEDYTGAPAAASTPLRAAMEKFRIVDIERPADLPGIRELEGNLGDDNSAAGMDVSRDQGDAVAAANPNNKSAEKGDAGSTNHINSDENSARAESGEVNSAMNSDGEAAPAAMAAAADAVVTPTVSGYQTESGNKGTKPSGHLKVPSMVKPPIMPPPPPIELDATASDMYKAIMAGRSVKNTPSTLRGTGRAPANTDWGSFYNKGDNRVSRSVYIENVAKMYVSSMSFNPVSWECSACPRKHSILGGGGGTLLGGGEGRTVILLTDQNFPAVLPSGNGITA
jgi:hypothetical protein